MGLQGTLFMGLLAATVTGCAIHEGGFEYTASGRLIDDQHEPVSGRMVVLSLSSLPPTTQPAHRTDNDGHFSQELGTGLAWGYTDFFGIPLGSTNPKPPPIQRIYITLERSPGEWVQREIPLTKSQQKQPGIVELGDVPVPN